MTPTPKQEKDHIAVPAEWFESLYKIACAAQLEIEISTDRRFECARLVGYAKSCDAILKYNERLNLNEIQ